MYIEQSMINYYGEYKSLLCTVRQHGRDYTEDLSYLHQHDWGHYMPLLLMVGDIWSNIANGVWKTGSCWELNPSSLPWASSPLTTELLSTPLDKNMASSSQGPWVQLPACTLFYTVYILFYHYAILNYSTYTYHTTVCTWRWFRDSQLFVWLNIWISCRDILPTGALLFCGWMCVIRASHFHFILEFRPVMIMNYYRCILAYKFCRTSRTVDAASVQSRQTISRLEGPCHY